MANLIYVANTSLDGYTEDKDGMKASKNRHAHMECLLLVSMNGKNSSDSFLQKIITCKVFCVTVKL